MLGARVKSGVGASWQAQPTVASAAALYVNNNVTSVYISGDTAVTSIATTFIQPGRRLTFIGAASASVLFTNTNDTTTKGQMDLGGSDRTLGDNDVLTIEQRNDGSWVMILTTNN